MPSWKKVILSGSNAALNSLTVSTSLTASGIIYPTTDGTSGQVVITDGNGNLSFSNIENTTISIKNVSGGTIAKGTPCYITGSGTSGNLAGVWPADASNPLRMPAGIIAGETLTAGAEGVGLLNGFINGVNTSAFNAGDSVYVAVGGGYTNIKPTGSSVLIQKLGNVEKSAINGSGVINGPGYYNEVPNIQQGFTWVGNSNGVAIAVATSSIQNVVSASFATSASFALSSSFAVSSSRAVSSSFASTASFVTTLNQNVLITGSATIGAASAGASENTLTLGARDTTNEGGQIGFNAPGGTYTSASFIDNWQNKARLLRGNNTTSDATVASWDLHTKQMQLPQYTNASSFVGTAAANLAVDSSGNVITVSTSGGSVFPYTGNAVITGSLTTTGIIYAQPNGGMYFQGGDDAALYDINIADHMGIYGVQNSTVGAIKLGSSGPVLYGSGSNLGINTTNPSSASLTVNGNIWATSLTGSLLGTASFAVSSSRAVSSSFATLAASATSATTAATASFVTGSNVFGPFGSNSVTSASFAQTASFVSSTTNAFIQNGNSFGTTALLGTNDNQSLALETNGTTKMFISSSGNVGIGTTNPVVALDLGGSTGKAFHLYSSAGDFYGINMQQYDGGSFSTNIFAGDGGLIKFRTASGTTTQSTRMTITPGGNVGIGTTSPSNKLSLYDTTDVWLNITRNSSFVNIGVDSTGTFYNTNSNHRFLYNAGSNEAMRITSSGNVGIGTSSPTAKLHVWNGGIKTSGFPSAGNPFTFLESNYNDSVVNVKFLNINPTNGLDADLGIQLMNSGGTISDVFTIKGSSGNVGIGTSSPVQKLHVEGSAAVGTTGTEDILLLGRALSGGVSFQQAASLKLGRYQNAGGAFESYTRLDFALRDNSAASNYNTNTTVMTLTNAGNVGIGTTSPGATLDVRGNANFRSSSYLGVTLAPTSTGGDIYIYEGNNPKIYLQSAGDTIFNTGYNVGIGTTSPQTLLQLGEGSLSNTTTNQYLRVNAGGYNALSYAHLDLFNFGNNFGNSLGWRLTSGTEGAGVSVGRYLSFNTVVTDGSGNPSTSTERMRITSGGNVGIGTTSPSAKLDVNSTDDNAYALRVQGNTNNESGVWTGIGISGEAANTKSAIIFQDNGSSYSRGNLIFAINNAADQTNATPSNAVMTLLANGNVGIGTTAPTSKLYVEGGSADWSLPTPGTSVGTIHLDPGVDTNNYGNAITFGASDSAAGVEAQAGIYVRSDGAYGTKMYFGTTDSYVAGSKIGLTIDESQRVGIGTTSPSAKLQVDGISTSGFVTSIVAKNPSTNAASAVKIGFDAGGTIWGEIGASYNSNNPYLGFYVRANLEKMRITDVGNVGIGTTDPQGKLDVQLDTTGDHLVRTWNTNTSGTGKAIIRIANSGNNAQGSQIQFTDNDYYVGTLTADRTNGMAFYVGQQGSPLASERMRIATNGAIKFNTYGAGTFTGTATQKLAVDSSGNVIEIPIGAGPVDGSGTTNYITKWTDADTIGNSVMFESSSRIGIGTTTPSAKLDVNGSAYIAGTITLPQNPTGTTYGNGVSASPPYMINQGAGDNDAIRFYAESAATNQVSMVFEINDDIETAGNEWIWRNKKTYGGYEATTPMLLSGAGAATFLSSVTATQYNILNSNQTIGIANTSDIQINAAVASSNILFRVSGDERMRITSSGNVGIGTTSPYYKTTINGNPRNTDVLCVASDQINADSVQSYVGISLQDQYADGGGNASAIRSYSNLYSQWGSTLTFSTTGTGGNGVLERMRITNAGDVAIGTTAALLNGGGRGNVTINGSSESILVLANGGVWKSYLFNDGVGNTYLASAGALTFSANGNDRMRIDTSGNVGIGTTTPGVKFVNLGAPLASGPTLGSGTVGSQALISANGLYGMYSGISSSGDVWHQVQRNDGNTTVYNLLFQPSGGNVGIGTTSPTYKLDVVGNGRFSSDLLTTGRFGVGSTNINSRVFASAFSGELSAAIFTTFDSAQSTQEAARFSTSDLTTGAVRIFPRVGVASYNGITVADSAVIANAPTKPLLIGVQDGSAIQFTTTDIRIGTNNAERMRIDSSGNVGIGTTTPTLGTLQVNGNVFATSFTGSLQVTSSLSYNSSLSTSNVNGEIAYWGGGTVAAGNLYYYDSSGNWTAADADAESTSTGMLGIALAAGTASTVGILLRGHARFTGVSSFTGTTTVGAKLYVSTTAGAFSQTAPTGTGDVVRIIGYVQSTANDQIYFCPDTTWVTLL